MSTALYRLGRVCYRRRSAVSAAWGAVVAVVVTAPHTRVCMTSPSVSFDTLPRRSGVNTALIGAVTRLLAGNVAPEIRCRVHGMRARFVWGSSLITNEVGPMLWADFLPAALAQGRYVPAPTPQVIGSGLQHVQPALDTLRAGVLARKLVVLL